MYTEEILQVLVAIKDYIVVDTGDDIRNVESITITDDENGYLIVLKED